MKKNLLIFVFLLFSCNQNNGTNDDPTNNNPLCSSESGERKRITVDLDGSERSYIIELPPCYKKQQPTPLLIFFHGLLAEAEGQASFTGFSEVAKKYQFIIVYAESGVFAGPNGNLKGWELYNDLDIRYTQKILLDIKSRHSIDPQRVYGCGHSLGGRLSMVVGSELSSEFAAMCAFAPALASLSTSYVYAPQIPMPFVLIQGNNDRIISPLLRDQELTSTRQELIAGNVAVLSETRSLMSNGSWADEILYRPSGGGLGAPVLWLYIDGMGHLQWPSPFSAESFPSPFDVNEYAWLFMTQYHR